MAIVNVTAPYGCVVFQHCCSVGQHMTEGSDIISIEAMKMETVVSAPCSGTVTWLRAMGDQAEEGDVLATIESD